MYPVQEQSHKITQNKCHIRWVDQFDYTELLYCHMKTSYHQPSLPSSQNLAFPWMSILSIRHADYSIIRPSSVALWKAEPRGPLSCPESQYALIVLTVSYQMVVTRLVSQFWLCGILLSGIASTDIRLFPGSSSLFAFLLPLVFPFCSLSFPLFHLAAFTC